ncbi:MAG: PQQ-dependent sugar dehydrogenase, partial [Bdellovibrio sp.]
GGLLDVRVHPVRKNEIYFTYSLPQGQSATTALARGTLEGTQLKQVKNIFVAHEANSNEIHFGSRIEFDRDGHIFITVGDRNERKQVQDLGYHMGKVLRLNEDGSAPQDNPFVQNKKARPEIWALGIRSPQGMAWHPSTGDLWVAEMGPRGGDELNIIKKGLNYGWPLITYGREYWGGKIGEKEKAGLEQPIIYWTPSISPSAMTFYTGSLFPQWKNNIFLANLSSRHLRRLVLEGNKVVQQEELLKDEARFRNVRTGPDGALYVSTDDGKIARLTKK